MKERQSIQQALRLLFLSKALYYSILWVLLATVLAALYTGYNFIFLPNLSVFRTIGFIFIVSILLSFILFPLRFLLFALSAHLFSKSRAGRLLKRYDGGLTGQYAELEKGSTLERWSASKVLNEVERLLPTQISVIKNDWNAKKVATILIALGLILAFVPIDIWKESSLEIVSGQLRNSKVEQLELPDSLIFNYAEEFNLNTYKSNSYNSNWLLDKWLVLQDTSVEWSAQGRFIKRTFIICDSVPRLSAWEAFITPPAYLNINPYVGRDTIQAYVGSLIQLHITGVLLDQATVKVSRGTYDINDAFELTDSLVEIHALRIIFNAPVKLLKDEHPSIAVVSNYRDSVKVVFTDDFGLVQARVDKKTIGLQGTSMEFTLFWEDTESTNIILTDTKGNRSSRLLRRLKKTTEDILAEARSETNPLETFTPDKDLDQLETSQKNRKKKNQKNERIEKLERKDSLLKQREEEAPKRTPEELKELLEKLDELWNAEQLLEVLNHVDTTANEALDSAIAELAEDLEQSEDEAIKEVAKEVQELPKQGEDRKEQAKDAVKKLQEALAEAEATVAEENVERIKRLLKSSWMTSTMQEGLQRGSEVRDIKTQRNLLLLEQRILDSLSMLIVSDPALAQALSVTQSEFSANLRALKSEFKDNGLEASGIGYVLTALNEIDKVLYFILESEKQSLAAAKKKCKSGTPGAQGKPSRSGSGTKGKKGKKPGEGKEGKAGRKPGKTGGKRPAKSGKQGDKGGDGGKSDRIKEGLKRIDDAIKEGGGPGANKALERKLEQLKQELLFDSQRENFNLDDVERRLWEATKSTFEKEEKGKERKSNSAEDQSGQGGKEVPYKLRKNTESALPLPVLKKQKK